MPSPDDYRRSAGFRRSSASGLTIPHASWAYGDNPLSENYVFEDLADPRLAAFVGAGRHTSAGVRVGEHLALRNSTFNRSCNLIATSMGMLPIHLMRNLPNGDTEEAQDHPFYRVLKSRPNDFQTAMEFKSQLQMAALLDGNAYALVVRGFRGKIVALIPMKRGTMTPLLSEDYKLTFRYNPAGGGSKILAAGDVFHFRSPITLDGLRGVSLLDVAAQAIGIASQAEHAAGRLFRQGVLVGGALESASTLSDKAYARLREDLEERYSSAENAQKWMILEEGLKASTLTGDPDKTQHLETRQRQSEEILRFTGVPRPLAMLDGTTWGTGTEVLGQFFVTYCLLGWFVAWEQAIERCLTDAEQGTLYAKFNDGALLRGSLKDQASFFASALGSGGSQAWMTPDEVRANFDQNKIAGGDQLPARAAAKAPTDPSDAPDDPPAPPDPKETKNG
ncbi:phage portal protein [Sphingomonas bacterium]|uniref:phage portal protein n=1 Tax=Sphingomonas bacterium TaxID=1895847 RepID=UPI001575EBDC|nr:phage portal protein [Sphingomonas bacterium]